jgi:hypothetical protein
MAPKLILTPTENSERAKERDRQTKTREREEDGNRFLCRKISAEAVRKRRGNQKF